MNGLRYCRAVLILLCVASCVPQKKYLDATTTLKSARADSAALSLSLYDCNKKKDAAVRQVTDLTERLEKLQDDTSRLSTRYRQTKQLYENLDAIYEKVIQQNKNIQDELTSQKQTLNTDLQKKQNDLDVKSSELNATKQQLDKKQKDIDSLTQGLAIREEHVKQLEQALNKKDSAAANLKRHIAEALFGFDKSDLTVEQKNGKVYVSMSDKLLFKSGSTIVEAKGVEALQKLADALNLNKDISINVEGHTDNKPLSSANYPKDNLDLSVLRATSVAKLLITDGVDAGRIVSSGRGKTQPVADNTTPEGRAKNRRTEIILTPRLDELLKVLGNN